MASTEADLKTKFDSLLKDVENYYSNPNAGDTKENSEDHKVRALRFFSQEEIDDYCFQTCSLDSFNKTKIYYLDKVEKAQKNLERLAASSEKIQKKIDALMIKKSGASAIELQNIETEILSHQAGLSINEKRKNFCLDDIKVNQAKLDEGAAMDSSRTTLIEKLRNQAMAMM